MNIDYIPLKILLNYSVFTGSAHGYGRIEYLSAMVISVIILYVGITSLVEAIKKIFNPIEPSYNLMSIIIVSLSVIVKLVIAHYFLKVGDEVKSDSLINSGEDSKLDSIVSFSILLAAGIFVMFDISLEAYLGAIISIIIIKSAIDMLSKTISQLLGEKIDPELAQEVIKTVENFPGVEGASALVLNNYGPNDWNGSIDIGVPETHTAEELDEIIRDIQLEVYYKHQRLDKRNSLLPPAHKRDPWPICRPKRQGNQI